MMKLKLLIYTLLLPITLFSQKNAYHYKRALNGIKYNWHYLYIPDAVFAKTNKDLSDLRFYGITKDNDTLEAAYLLDFPKKEEHITIDDFKILNRSVTKDGYYYTLELSHKQAITQIQLFFKNNNFDWRIQLAGSHNQKKWFTIIDNYRILSIKNKTTQYTFTKLHFSETNYHFYRLFIKTKDKVSFDKVRLSKHKANPISYRKYSIKKQETRVDKKTKQSTLSVELATPVPVSCLHLSIDKDFDFYRPIRIEYLADSIKTEEKTLYQYRTLYRGIISSLEENQINFKRTITKKIRIIIDNYDNPKLHIHTISVEGIPQKILLRFTNSKIPYYCYYGNKNAIKPNYELKAIATRIPKNIDEVRLGEEEIINANYKTGTKGLFTHPIWLWAILLITILLLGSFSINMLRSK